MSVSISVVRRLQAGLETQLLEAMIGQIRIISSVTNLLLLLCRVKFFVFSVDYIVSVWLVDVFESRLNSSFPHFLRFWNESDTFLL